MVELLLSGGEVQKSEGVIICFGEVWGLGGGGGWGENLEVGSSAVGSGLWALGTGHWAVSGLWIGTGWCLSDF